MVAEFMTRWQMLARCLLLHVLLIIIIIIIIIMIMASNIVIPMGLTPVRR